MNGTKALPRTGVGVPLGARDTPTYSGGTANGTALSVNGTTSGTGVNGTGSTLTNGTVGIERGTVR